MSIFPRYCIECERRHRAAINSETKAMAAEAELARLRAETDRLYAERRRDALDGQAALDESHNEVVRLRAELAAEKARTDHSGKLLAGIYAMMYPAPIKTADGRTMVFRPKSPDPHAVLQELSDRIRALSAALAQEPPA